MRKSALNSSHTAKILSSIPTKPKVLTAVILQALALQAAQAATVEVTSNLDNGTDCTLREAVQSVNMGSNQGGCSSTGTFGNNDTISFAPNVSGSTITLTGGDIRLDEDVSINPNGSETTISGLSGIFYNGSYGFDVSLDHLVLTGADTSSGGAIFWYCGGGAANRCTLSLTNSTITGNTAVNGGGLWMSNTNATISDSEISGNTADISSGGAIAAYYNSQVTLTNTTVSNNSAISQGGGLKATSSTLNLTNSTVSGNTAISGGGGLYAINFSTVILTDSTVSANTADFGGGLRAFFSTVNLTNSTVSGNTADFEGGGLYTRSSTVTLTNTTVSNNSAATRGGGLRALSSTVDLTNSIIANSLGGDDCERDAVTATVTAGPDSIIEVDSCGTSAQNIDPGLMTLAANGGPTETHALMPGSPAIDAGNNGTCEATDQRGEARDDGACDIGAYEFKATVMPIARKDRKMGSLMTNGEQWYSFNSTESQKLSMQTNGFSGDTVLEFYTGNDPKMAINIINTNDDSGPALFSNIKQEVISGPHLIRVKGKTNVDPYWLRLMSDRDILSFNDTNTHFANKEIRVMSSAGITGGCGTNKYCPTDPVTRAQMAIFMLKAILGGNHSSPAATGTVFNDVSTSSFGASFIEEFSTLGITSGCGGGKYCPDLAVTREQMAVFLLRAWYGSSYTPPTATPAEINQFSDIANSFARDWIVQLTKENITGGCGGGKFCPTDTVTRGQMAAFIARTFDLDVEL